MLSKLESFSSCGLENKSSKATCGHKGFRKARKLAAVFNFPRESFLMVCRACTSRRREAHCLCLKSLLVNVIVASVYAKVQLVEVAVASVYANVQPVWLCVGRAGVRKRTHAEGYGCHNQLRAIMSPVRLSLFSLLLRHVGMIVPALQVDVDMGRFSAALRQGTCKALPAVQCGRPVRYPAPKSFSLEAAAHLTL